MLAESGEGGSGARRGLFRVREAPGRAPGQPLTAPRRGQLGPAGGGEVRALRGGTRAAPRPPPPGERRAPPRCSEGRSGGTAPTAPLRVGSRGRTLSPTAPRGGHRSPQLTLAGGRPGPRGRRRRWKLRAPLGARTLAAVKGTERNWGAQVSPDNTAAGRNTSDGSTPRFPNRGTESKPGLLSPAPADSVQAGGGPAPVPKPTGGCLYRDRVPGRSQRERWRCRSGGSAPARRASCSPKGARLGGTEGLRQGSPRRGRRGEAAGGQRGAPRLCSASDGTPRPAPGTSPACKVLSGFLSVKRWDNYKPLKTDGVSSPSFTHCKPPRLATRYKRCPLRSSTPPKKGEQRRDSRSRDPRWAQSERAP